VKKWKNSQKIAKSSPTQKSPPRICIVTRRNFAAHRGLEVVQGVAHAESRVTVPVRDLEAADRDPGAVGQDPEATAAVIRVVILTLAVQATTAACATMEHVNIPTSLEC
jgi:hypothetical protein